MKKILLLIALMAMTATASAQILGEGKVFSGNLDVLVIPKQFTYDGKPLLFMVGNGTVSVLNDNIEKVREFEVVGTSGYEGQKLNTETNEWVTTEYESFLAQIWCMDGDDNSYACYDDDANLSQTLFNTDEKFEYIRMDYDGEDVSEHDSDGDGVMDRRSIYRSNRIGFSIVQEDGTVLQSVKGDYDDDFMVLKMDGKVYLVAEREGENDENYAVFFLIDKKANSIKQVNMLPSMKVRPSVADRDQQVTVDLEGDAREIQVVNAAGQTIKRIPVGEGQRQVVFNTRGLNSGVNMVHARGKGKDVTRKFIIK